MTHMLCSKSSEAIPALSENQTEKKYIYYLKSSFGLIHPKMKILLSLTNPHVVPNQKHFRNEAIFNILSSFFPSIASPCNQNCHASKSTKNSV